MANYDEKQIQQGIKEYAKKKKLLDSEIEQLTSDVLYAYNAYNKYVTASKEKLSESLKLQNEINDLEKLGKDRTQEQNILLKSLKKELIETKSTRDKIRNLLTGLSEDFPELQRVLDIINKQEDEAIQKRRERAKKHNEETIAAIKQEVQDAFKYGKEVEDLAKISKEMTKKHSAKLWDAYNDEKKQQKEVEKRQKELDALLEKKKNRNSNLTEKEKESIRQAEIALQNAKEELETKQKVLEERKKLTNTESNLKKLTSKEEWGNALAKTAANTINKGVSDIANALQSDIDLFTQSRAKMMARLQGATSYNTIIDNIVKNIGLSPYVSQRDMVKNIQTLITEGVSFNLEQRGFLMTIAEKIAPTFDAANKTLQRIIRLQGEDTTAARLGLEAALTQSLNAAFRDTAYLSDLFTTIRDAIFDAESQLNKEAATEFEYTTQKWLSSIYEVGGSQSFITNLAQGINMLGTGNVTGLASNESMQTLLAMALSRSNAGASYSDILLGGLNASSVNEVLFQVVEYLREIADTNNMVVKSQYANLFGLTVGDLNAIRQLTPETMNELYQQNLGYKDLTGELTSQFGMLGNRLTLGEMIQTAIGNLSTSSAAGIATTPALLAAWQLNTLVEGATGGINIPAINLFGTGIDLNATLNQLIKLGLGGAGLIAEIGNILSSFGSSPLDLSSWDVEAKMRGGSFVASTSGVTTGLSSSTSYIGSGSYSDIERQTLTEGTERAENVQEVTGAAISNEGKTSDDIWHAMFDEDSGYSVRVKLVDVDYTAFKNISGGVPVRLESGPGTEASSPLQISTLIT